MADLACYWSRVGEFERAESVKIELRQFFGKGENLHVSVRLLCLDALLLFFKESDPLSRDRMLRAKLLSSAAGDKSLIALTSSWLAQLDFNYNHIDSMLDNIEETFRVIERGDDIAECRVSLVLAGVTLYYGDQSSAKVWHEKTRSIALRLGDQATIGALLYNRAVYKTTLARLNDYDQKPDTYSLVELEIDVQNAINYQQVAQVRSLAHWLKILEINYLMLAKRFEHAASLIHLVLKEGKLHSSSGMKKILEADLLLARSKQERKDDIAAEFAMLSADTLEGLTTEERAQILQSWSLAASANGLQRQAKIWNSMREGEMTKSRALAKNIKLKLAARDG